MNNRYTKYSGCGSPEHLLPLMSSRRDFLQVGLIGGLGLTLPQFFGMEANAAQKFYESKEYTEARKIRELAADTNLMLVEGI